MTEVVWGESSELGRVREYERRMRVKGAVRDEKRVRERGRGEWMRLEVRD